MGVLRIKTCLGVFLHCNLQKFIMGILITNC